MTTTPGVGIEEFLRSKVRSCRAAFKAAFEAGDSLRIVKESLEVNAAESVLTDYLAAYEASLTEPIMASRKPVRRKT